MSELLGVVIGGAILIVAHWVTHRLELKSRREERAEEQKARQEERDYLNLMQYGLKLVAACTSIGESEHRLRSSLNVFEEDTESQTVHAEILKVTGELVNTYHEASSDVTMASAVLGGKAALEIGASWNEVRLAIAPLASKWWEMGRDQVAPELAAQLHRELLTGRLASAVARLIEEVSHWIQIPSTLREKLTDEEAMELARRIVATNGDPQETSSPSGGPA